jgi:hypothetical protein
MNSAVEAGVGFGTELGLEKLADLFNDEGEGAESDEGEEY